MDYKLLEDIIVNMKLTTEEQRIEFMNKELKKYLGVELTEWMIENGFCSAPASISHHGNYVGGLFDHSISVTACLLKYTERLGLVWGRKSSPVLIGMLHDLCKIDQYKIEPDYENNDVSFSYSNTSLVNGHSSKSLIYALQHGMKLTEEETICIMYHMGAFPGYDSEGYTKAVQKWSNVLYTHTADMESSQIWGV